MLSLGLLGLCPCARAGPPSPAARGDGLERALELEPGATCLDRPSLLGHLRTWRPADDLDARIRIVVRGDPRRPNALSFVLYEGDRALVERSFDPAPSDCADLHAVVALALAIALDDTLAGELGIAPVEATPTPGTQPVAQVQATRDDLPTEDAAPAPPRRRRPVLAVTTAVGLFAGVTPRLSTGGLVSFDIRPLDRFDLRLSVLATHLPGFALDEGQVAATVAAGRFDLCWGTLPMAVRLRLCGGVAAGAAVARGRGFGEDFRRTSPWLAGVAGVDLSARLIGPLFLELRLEGMVPFQRTRVDVRSETGERLASQRFPVAALLVTVGPRVEF